MHKPQISSLAQAQMAKAPFPVDTTIPEVTVREVPEKMSADELIQAFSPEYSPDFNKTALPSGPRTLESNNPKTVPPSHSRSNDSQSNSTSTLSLVREDDDLDLSFRGGTEANVKISKEKAVHKLMMFLASQGMTNREIAREVGYTDAWVSQITRQDWFKEQVEALMKASGVDAVKRKITAAADEAFDVVTQLMKKADSENVKMNCAFSILDRHLGKAVQKSENVNETKITFEDVTEIDAELKKVNDELKRIGAG